MGSIGVLLDPFSVIPCLARVCQEIQYGCGKVATAVIGPGGCDVMAAEAGNISGRLEAVYSPTNNQVICLKEKQKQKNKQTNKINK